MNIFSSKFSRFDIPKKLCLSFTLQSMASNTYTSKVNKFKYYQPSLINPRLTDEKLDSLMHIDNSQEIGVNAGTQVEKGGGYDCKNQKNASEFLLMGVVDAQGWDTLFIDDEYNSLLFMLGKPNLRFFGVIDDSILAGTTCKRELSDTRYIIPRQNRNPADIDRAQGATDNVAEIEDNEDDNIGHVNGDIAYAGGVGDGGDSDGGANNDQNDFIVIYIYQFRGQDLSINLVEQIDTTIEAKDWPTWDELTNNILAIYLQRNPAYIPVEHNFFRPSDCWPRSETIFGRRSNGRFQSFPRRAVDRFEDHEAGINCLLVIQNVGGNKLRLDDHRMYGLMYEFDHEAMEIDLMDHFSEVLKNHSFRSWAEFSREMYRIYGEITEDEVVDVDVGALNPANCWPGADTIFGNWVQEKFRRLNWPDYMWDDIAHLLNCAILIRY